MADKSTINIMFIIIGLGFLPYSMGTRMSRIKGLLTILGAGGLLFEADAISTEARTTESQSSNTINLLEESSVVRGTYSYQGGGHFTVMPTGPYPGVSWQLIKTPLSVRTDYVPTQALAITVTLKEGTYDGHGLQFAIPIATNQAMIRVMVRYDFDGSGKTDRVEMYYPTMVNGSAVLTHAAGIEDNRSYGRFPMYVSANASVTLLVWIPEGMTLAKAVIGQSFVKVPFNHNAEARLSEAGDDDDAIITPAGSSLVNLTVRGSSTALFADNSA